MVEQSVQALNYCLKGNYLQQCSPETGIWVHKAAQKCRKFRQQNFPIVATSAVFCQTLNTDVKSKILFEKCYWSTPRPCDRLSSVLLKHSLTQNSSPQV